MTITLPLPRSSSKPSRLVPSRSFGELEEPHYIQDSLMEVVHAVRAAKRIVVISEGAGVSTGASIPDFRSAKGLFASKTNVSGRKLRSSKGESTAIVLPAGKKPPAVKDLFHVKSLSDEEMLPAHHNLLNSLYKLSEDAIPTPFHSFLSTLDNNGQLLRCYTQNIDGLEEKAGLEVGLPRPRERVSPKRRRIHPPTPESRSSPSRSLPPSDVHPSISLPCTPPRSSALDTPTSLPATPQSPSTSIPSNTFPRVIPLHGLLSTVKCTFCPHSVPFAMIHPLPPHHLPCPACSDNTSERSAASKRKRSEGLLRPSVVLYGEEHPQGHLIGKVVERDLKGLGGKGEKEGKVDFLIVAGTSLSIPGVKRMVKEMSKSLEERGGLRRIYINDDAPSHPREMEDVFNVWIKGDVQRFIVDYLDNPSFGVLPPTPPKTPRKRLPNHSPQSHSTSTPTKKHKRNKHEPVSPSRTALLSLPHAPAPFRGVLQKTEPEPPRSPSLTPLSDSSVESDNGWKDPEDIVTIPQ